MLERAAHATAAGAAEAHNQSECALIVLLREYDAGCENAVLVMRPLSIRSLWLLRGKEQDALKGRMVSLFWRAYRVGVTSCSKRLLVMRQSTVVEAHQRRGFETVVDDRRHKAAAGLRLIHGVCTVIPSLLGGGSRPLI